MRTNLFCRIIGHKTVTAAVHNKNSMRATTVIVTKCTRCGAELEKTVLSKKQLTRRSK